MFRNLILSIILGGFFSACTIFGENIFSQDTAAINNFSTWLEIFLATPIFSAVVFFVFKFTPKFNEIFYFDLAEFFSLRKFFLISWTLIFFAWLPALFAQYPGIFGYDALVQVFTYNINLIWLHFPPAHTALLGFFTSTLGKFFGSHEVGFLFYTLLQMAALAGTFAIISAYMFAKKISGVWIIAWQIFFMFFPLNPIMAMSATKDIFYAIFFALSILLLEKISDGRFLLPVILTSFLAIIFRPQGIYVFLFGMLAGIFLLKNARLQILKITFACVGLFLVYNFALTNFFGGVKDSNDTLREMSSMPIVQLSRVAIYRRDEISAEEFARIKKYIPDVETYAEKISQGSSDLVKANFNSALVRENPKEFFGLWKKFLLKYPTDYFDAFCRLTAPLWYPPLEFEKYYAAQPYFQYESFKQAGDWIIFVENPFESRTHEIFKIDASFQIGERFISGDETKNNLIVIENKTLFGLDWLNEFYKNLAYNYSYEKIPVVRFLFSSGFIFWLLMIYIFYCLSQKNYRGLFPASFLFGLWGTMILGPITLFRYIFPLALCLPILFTRIMSSPKL